MSKQRTPPKLKKDDPPKGFHGDQGQFERFVREARELGCPEDEAAFDDTLKKIASAPPPKTVKKRKTKKPAK
jgi:hypothetical protein